MIKHACLSLTLSSDKGSDFVSHLIKEVGGFVGIALKHATRKQAQTIGMLEHSHNQTRVEDWDRLGKINVK